MKLWIVNLRFFSDDRNINVSVILNIPADLHDPLSAIKNNLDWMWMVLDTDVGFEVMNVVPFNPEQHGVI